MKSRLFHGLAALAAVTLATACGKSGEPTAEAAPAASAAPVANGRLVEINASNEGYKPSTIEAKKGETLVLRFTRTTPSECLAQIVFPDLKITKDLPINKPVDVSVKAEKEGKIPFQCGMAMLKGTINVTGG